MPNGFYGSAEEWERMEAPFRLLDGELERFARSHRLVLTKNYHNWPGRWLQWGSPITRRIDIHGAEGGRFAVSILAYEDRERARYGKDETVFEGSLAEVQAAMPGTLERAKRMAEAWQAEDLDFLVTLRQANRARSALLQIGSWAVAAAIYLLPVLVLGWIVLRVISCAGE